MDKNVILRIFYDRLQKNIFLKKKIKTVESVLYIFQDTKSNDRARLLKESAIHGKDIQQEVINVLIDQKLIRMSDEVNMYTITCKGVYEIEASLDEDYIEKLIQFMDKKYFDFCKDVKTINGKEKVLLMALIAVRAFSVDCCADLQKNQAILDVWEEIVNLTGAFLKSKGVVSTEEIGKLFRQGGNEHPVSNYIRHTDALPKKVKYIFKAVKPQKYFLDIYVDGKINWEKIKFLLYEIFCSGMDISLCQDIANFCAMLANDKGIIIYDNPELISPIYDIEFNDELIQLSL